MRETKSEEKDRSALIYKRREIQRAREKLGRVSRNRGGARSSAFMKSTSRSAVSSKNTISPRVCNDYMIIGKASLARSYNSK